MSKLLLFLIIFLGLLLRVLWIDKYPIGFTPDEASFGYDAYSILQTGRDQWGTQLPLTLRSFGDYKLPLYTYLAIPSVAVFGLNEFSTRLPNAIIGTLVIFATYLLAKRIFDYKVALFAALLIAISPWHISLSRGAFEANLTTFFLPFGVWAYFEGLKNRKWMSLAVLALGLNMFSYHSARIITPLIVLSLFYLTRKELGPFQKIVKTYPGAMVLTAVFVLLLGWSIVQGGATRGGDIAIFNPTGGWGAVADRRYEADNFGLADSVSRIFSNKLTYIVGQFINSHFSYLSTQFLFIQGAGEWTYGMIPGRGVLYLFEIPFLFAVIIRFKSDWGKQSIKLIAIWILLAPLAAALTKGPGYAANRTAIMMPAIQILSAYGAILSYDYLRKNIFKSSLFLNSMFAVIISIFLFGFIEDYFYHAPIHQAQSMLYGRGDAIKEVKNLESGYEKVVISRQLSEPQMYLAFYTKWDPSDFQKESQNWLGYQNQEHPFVDQLGEYSLGKYVFKNIDYNSAQKGVLLVGRASEFPEKISTLKTIYYPDNTQAIYITTHDKN